MKTRNGTTFVAAMATATATAMEDEEYNEWEGTNPQRRLDDALLRLADEIILRSIAVMMVGAATAAAAGSPAIAPTLMPVINVGELFIGREEKEGNDGSGIATEDNDDADAEVGEYARDYLEVALSRLWEGRFGRRTTTAKTMETSRDDEHNKDVMVQLMFGMLCPPEDEARPQGGPCRCCPTACPSRRSPAQP